MKRLSNKIQRTDISLTKTYIFKDSLAMRFQEASKYDKFSFLRERGNIALFSNPLVVERAIQPYKSYPSSKKLALKASATGSLHPMFEVMSNRRSTRNFANYSLSTQEIYNILHYSYGITGEAEVRNGKGMWHYRAVPSGGALSPLEIYLYINNSVLEKGLYHYKIDTEELEELDLTDSMEFLAQNIAASNINLQQCSCIIFITSMLQRQMIKYGERGYRFILQEVGAVLQNISLSCEAQSLGSCILGGYMDDHLNEWMKIESPFETIQGVIVIGKLK